MRNSFLIQYAIDFLIVKSLICITYKISDLFSFAFITLCFYEFFLLHLGISCYLSFCNICRLDIKASSSLLTIKIECKTNNHIYTNTHTHEKKEDKRERERERERWTTFITVQIVKFIQLHSYIVQVKLFIDCQYFIKMTIRKYYLWYPLLLVLTTG